MNAQPRFSVIVPACNRPLELSECLTHLAPGAQTLPAEKYEVIISDDSGGDEVARLVRERFSWARWTAGPRRGPAANRNHGAAQTRGAWLAFTDDDCRPDPGWLAAFDDALERAPTVAVLEGRTYADRPRRSLAERAPLNSHGGFLWSCNLAVRAELFRRLGGFDEDFPYAAMEDVDFARRLRAAGAAETFVPGAGVCHPWREIAGFRGMWAAEERHLESVRHYLTRHPGERVGHTPARLLRENLRRLLRETLPGAWAFRGRGLGAALAWHLHKLKCAWLAARGRL